VVHPRLIIRIPIGVEAPVDLLALVGLVEGYLRPENVHIDIAVVVGLGMLWVIYLTGTVVVDEAVEVNLIVQGGVEPQTVGGAVGDGVVADADLFGGEDLHPHVGGPVNAVPGHLDALAYQQHRSVVAPLDIIAGRPHVHAVLDH